MCSSQDKVLPRRWSSNQVKEFGPLHGTLSLLVRHSDMSIFESDTENGDSPKNNPYMLPSQREDLQPPSDGMHQALFAIDHSKRFIKEVRGRVLLDVHVCVRKILLCLFNLCSVF